LAAWDEFEPAKKLASFFATVVFDDADHNVDAFALLVVGFEQHLIRLADAWRRAEEELEPAAPFSGREFEQGVW